MRAQFGELAGRSLIRQFALATCAVQTQGGRGRGFLGKAAAPQSARFGAVAAAVVPGTGKPGRHSDRPQLSRGLHRPGGSQQIHASQQQTHESASYER